jgi:hypothetical protein
MVGTRTPLRAEATLIGKSGRIIGLDPLATGGCIKCIMNARNWLALLLLGLIVQPLTAIRAEEVKNRGETEIDTQFIFGFTAGADVGELGENEIEHQSIGRWGKRDGFYAALSDQLRYEHAPAANFRFEIGVPVAFHDISGVTGLDDRQHGRFDGLVAEFRYRLLDRDHAPFALTIGAEPHWSRVDETGGEPVDNYGGELLVAVDRELIKDRIFGAFNLIYDPEVTRSRETGLWQREATVGLSASITTQVRPGIFVGAEGRYLRKYDSLDLSAFTGQALFAGPTMFVRVSTTLAISGAWGVQLAGHSADVPGSLDLTNFTRYQALFRLEYNF